MIEKVRNYYLYFMFYSIFGWLYEVFLEVFIYRWGFSNRGVLFGPYCVIYGFGGVTLVLLLYRLKQKKISIGSINVTPVVIFVSVVIITTIMELAGSYIMEYRTGEWMWNYTRFAFNFQGRIALNPSLRFGLGGMIFLYILQPLYEKLTGCSNQRALNIFTVILATLFALDVAAYLLR